MKTQIQAVILFLYGWRMYKAVYFNPEQCKNDYYPLYYKKGFLQSYGYRYHPVDLAWSKQFGTDIRHKSKRVIAAIILGDIFTYGLIIWFILWLLYSLHRGY